MRKKYKKLLEKVYTSEKPTIFLNACTHGHEKIGLEVINEVKKNKIQEYNLLTNIANKRAFLKNTAFIDSDLNRSFPGKETGNYEERLAYYLSPIIKKSDIVIDIHSTNTVKDPEKEAMVIITKINKEILDLIELINPPIVLIMKYKNTKALISQAKAGLAFEYGPEGSKKTLKKILNDLKKILENPKGKNPKTRQKKNNSTSFYEVYNVLEKKNNYKLLKKIKNFKKINKGTKIAKNKNNNYLIAPETFYPILFGENRYEKIYGFLAKKISNPRKFYLKK